MAITCNSKGSYLKLEGTFAQLVEVVLHLGKNTPPHRNAKSGTGTASWSWAVRGNSHPDGCPLNWRMYFIGLFFLL